MKLSKIAQIKYKKDLQEVFKLGREHDKCKDPVRKAELAAEIERRCNAIKEKAAMDGIVGTKPTAEETAETTADAADQG